MSKENILRKAYRNTTFRGAVYPSDEKVAKKIIENNMMEFFERYDRNVTIEEIRYYINEQFNDVSRLKWPVWPKREPRT